jgi:hypothetical protein
MIGRTYTLTDDLCLDPALLALRSPHCERVAYIALSRTGVCLDARHVAVGCVCAATIAEDGDTAAWLRGLAEAHPEPPAHLIFVHNHPTGEASPSAADLAVARRIAGVARGAGFPAIAPHGLVLGNSHAHNFSMPDSPTGRNTIDVVRDIPPVPWAPEEPTTPRPRPRLRDPESLAAFAPTFPAWSPETPRRPLPLVVVVDPYLRPTAVAALERLPHLLARGELGQRLETITRVGGSNQCFIIVRDSVDACALEGARLPALVRDRIATYGPSLRSWQRDVGYARMRSEVASPSTPYQGAPPPALIDCAIPEDADDQACWRRPLTTTPPTTTAITP